MGAADRYQGQGSRVLQALGRVPGEDKHSWTVAIVRTDAEPVYNSQAWADYCTAPGSVKQHEVNAPYKHGQNGVPERSIGVLGLNAKSMMVEGGAELRLPVRDRVFLHRQCAY